jgi:hypothetical protein
MHFPEAWPSAASGARTWNARTTASPIRRMDTSIGMAGWSLANPNRSRVLSLSVRLMSAPSPGEGVELC